MTKENWKKIHKDFDEYNYWDKKSLQQKWEEEDFTYKEVEELVNNKSFWHWDFKFVAYLRKNKLLSLSKIDLEKEKREYYQVQTWLDFWYPKEKNCELKEDKKNYNKTRDQIIELDISGYKELHGFLKLEGFINLKKLICGGNQLAGLDLSHCINLEELHCSNNQLTKLVVNNSPKLRILNCPDNLLADLKLANNHQLEKLDISNNNFVEQDLSFLSHLINLKDLELGNKDKKTIEQSVYNRFIGSLEKLKNLSRLEKLDVTNTNINSGVEFLPNSINKIFYFITQRPESKIREIEKELDLFVNRKKWEESGFAFKEAKKWIEIGFKLKELDSVLSWNNYGFAPQQVKEWVNIGFSLFDSVHVNEWKKKHFSLEQTESWLNVGLSRSDYNFASYLKQNDYTPEKQINYSQKRLDHFYANKNQVKTIDLNDLKSSQPNELTISDYPNLEKIDGSSDNIITKLTISNCPQLEEINICGINNQKLTLDNLSNLNFLNCSDNKLTTLDLTNFPDLQKIDCSKSHLTEIKLPKGRNLEELNLNNNNLNQDLSFLKDLVNLKKLYLGNNPFCGNLEPLKNMNELELLNISDTDIDSGLKYLPSSIEKFACSTKERPNSKVRVIHSLFANEQGEVEEERGNIKNFFQNFQDYKQKTKKLEILEKQVKYFRRLIEQLKKELSMVVNDSQKTEIKGKLEEANTTFESKNKELEWLKKRLVFKSETKSSMVEKEITEQKSQVQQIKNWKS